jgi:hypothetical protein
LKKKRYLALGAVLVGAAVVALASWGYARPADASPARAQSEQKSFNTRNRADDGLRHLREEHGSLHFEGRDNESDDRGDNTTSGGGVTTTTTAGSTTTTTGATTTTTQATTTTTQATTTTTQKTTTTTQPPITTTTTAAINAKPLFASYCSCHTPGGTTIGSTLTAAQILTKITTGSMNGYASSLSSAQKSALANYVAGGGR